MNSILSTSLAAALALSGLIVSQSLQAAQLSYNTQVKVVSANLWHDLSAKAHYYDVGVAEFKHLDADVIFTQESDGVNARLANDLGMYFWQGNYSASSIGILSKFPIKKVLDTDATGSHLGAVLDVNGRDVLVLSNHWNYTQYVTYDARGGNGTTWAARKHCQAVSDSGELDALNDKSQRPMQAASLLQSIQPYLEQGVPVITGGDTNEPSGLDWTAATANMFDHKGTVHDYKSHRVIRAGGLTDSYRDLYPNPVTHPGASWPFRQEDSWAKGASYDKECSRALDDRDRIDFIYYNKHAQDVTLQSAAFVGPRFSTYFTGPDGQDANYSWHDPHVGRLVNSTTQEPEYGIYDFPSDHLWYQTTFVVKTPFYKSTTQSLDHNAQFSNVALSAVGNDLKVTFTLDNKQFMGTNINYSVNAAAHNASPSNYNGGSVAVTANAGEQYELVIGKSFLASQLDKNTVQLRLFHNNGASPRVDAVANLSWSDIKALIDFDANNLVTISPSKSVYGVNENIIANFNNAPGNAKDWIGIYHKGNPSDGSVYSIDWQYINGETSGSRTFNGLLAGEYLLRVFENNGYTLLAQTSFSVQ